MRTDTPDIYKKDLTEIIVEETVEDGALYKEVQTYLETEMPDELPLLRAYTDPSYPLVKCYNLEGAIREARQERVWMKSGAYLVIQPTEALTVIDVNSGKCLKKNSHFPEINRRQQGKQSARSGSAIFPVSLLLILST